MISDPWIDRSDMYRPRYTKRGARKPTTSETFRRRAAERRLARKQAGVCINGPLAGGIGSHGVEHGPVVRGNKCQRCIDVHTGTP